MPTEDITTNDPSAARILDLLAQLAVEWEEFVKLAEVAGVFRSQLRRILDGKFAWNSSGFYEKLAVVFGMDEIQLKAFLRGEMKSREAVALMLDALPVLRAELVRRQELKLAVQAAAAAYAKRVKGPSPKGLVEMATEWVIRRNGKADMAPIAIAALYATLAADPVALLPERLRLRTHAAPDVLQAEPNAPSKRSSGSDRPSRRR